MRGLFFTLFLVSLQCLAGLSYTEALVELGGSSARVPEQQAQPQQNWTVIKLEDGTKLKACVPSGMTGQIILVLPSGAEIRGWIY